MWFNVDHWGSLKIIRYNWGSWGDHWRSLEIIWIHWGSLGDQLESSGRVLGLKQMMMDGGADKDSYRDAIASKNYYNFY